MAIKTFATGEVLTASDTNTYLANSGLVYVTSTTIGSAVSSVTVSNCFSSTYDNYRIILSDATVSVGGSIGLQLNLSTGNTYYLGGIYLTFTNATVNGYGPAVTSRWNDVWAAETLQSTGALDLYSPNKAKRTTGACMSIKAGTTGASLAHYMMNMLEDSNNQHTGFTLYAVAATMTGGTVAVYGYRKA
jgi:uncharacterized membrane protein YeaQ/YmgE (transglycosylase-associated protein family)